MRGRRRESCGGKYFSSEVRCANHEESSGGGSVDVNPPPSVSEEAAEAEVAEVADAEECTVGTAMEGLHTSPPQG